MNLDELIKKQVMNDKILSDKPLIANYSFINNNIILSAIVTESGKQYLGMFHLNNEEIDDKSYINCIHTAVTNIPVNEFEEFNKNDNKSIGRLLVKSSENLKEINLEVTEKFKALKSWVAGIAEFGIESFRIQNDIEGLAKLQYPIARPLMNFAAKHDKKILGEFINYIQKECVHEGINHIPSLIANLELIKDVENSLTYVLSAGIPWEAIIEVYDKKSIASNEYATEFEEYKELFNDGWIIKKSIARNPKAVRLEEYKKLFTDPYWIVRQAVAENPEAVNLEEYEELFKDKNIHVRWGAAGNPNAKKSKGFNNIAIKELIKETYTYLEKNNNITENDKNLIQSIARNLNNLNPKEFSKESYNELCFRLEIARKSNAVSSYNSMPLTLIKIDDIANTAYNEITKKFKSLINTINNDYESLLTNIN